MTIEVTAFRPYQKNTLQGFANIRMTGVGIEIRDCPVHLKDGRRWVQTPARPYTDSEGKTQYAYIIDFYDKERRAQFQAAALKALDLFLKAGRENEEFRKSA